MDDLISRQAAIDAIAEDMPTAYTPDGSHPADEGIFRAQEIYADCIQTLKDLPPAEPKRLRGKWVFKNDLVAIPTGYYECSECKIGRLMYKENFCPNCGADMRGEQDE